MRRSTVIERRESVRGDFSAPGSRFQGSNMNWMRQLFRLLAGTGLAYILAAGAQGLVSRWEVNREQVRVVEEGRGGTGHCSGIARQAAEARGASATGERYGEDKGPEFPAGMGAAGGLGCARARRGPLRKIYRDYRRYRATGARSAVGVVVFTQGFWASAIFRLSHWAITAMDMRGLRWLVGGVCLVLQKATEVVTGISIPARCNIGAGLYVGHFGSIFIDQECRIGENCNVSQGVTIGEGGHGELRGVPVIGDRVHVGANALVLGKVSIGDDAVIGPGAVVMISVPPRGIAMGNPARIVSRAGSFESVAYDGMQEDMARKLALTS